MFLKMQPFCNSQQSTGHDLPPPPHRHRGCVHATLPRGSLFLHGPWWWRTVGCHGLTSLQVRVYFTSLKTNKFGQIIWCYTAIPWAANGAQCVLIFVAIPKESRWIEKHRPPFSARFLWHQSCHVPQACRHHESTSSLASTLRHSLAFSWVCFPHKFH